MSLKVVDSSLGRALVRWAQKDEIPFDASQVKIEKERTE